MSKRADGRECCSDADGLAPSQRAVCIPVQAVKNEESEKISKVSWFFEIPETSCSVPKKEGM